MERLVDYLSCKGCVTDVELISKLTEGIEHYCRPSKTELEIIDTVDKNVAILHHACIM